MQSDWILSPRPSPQARFRLFCFHTAGRGASMYAPLAKLLPAEIELLGIQLPGRENRIREKPLAHIDLITDSLFDALLPLFDRPFAFFGPSMGALVAFDFARKLNQTRGLSPVHLFFASRRAPNTPDRLPGISHLPVDEFADAVHARYNSIPAVIRQDRDLMDLFIPVLRADFQVIETYPYRESKPFDCPLSVLRGAADPVMLAADFDGWASHTTGAYAEITFPGGHFFFLEQPATTVEWISKALLTSGG